MNSAPSETQQRRVGVAERDRREPDAEQAAEQQPGGGEGAGDEALPVAREGVGEDQHDQQPVEEVHAGSPRSRVFGRHRRRSVWDHPAACSPAAHAPRSRPTSRRPAEEVEEPGDDPGGEAPQDDVACRGRSGSPGRSSRDGCAHGDPVRRGRAARRSAPGGPRAPRRGRRRRPRLGSRHQPSTGVTAKLLGGSHSSGSSPKTSTPAGSSPVSSSASRSAASTGGLAGVDRAAGEGHLAGVGAHVVGALGEQQVAARRGALAEQHQHGAAARRRCPRAA